MLWWRRSSSTTTTDVVTKRIVVLANSFKNNARCIAGREITGTSRDVGEIGPWVRPISTYGEGELSPDHYKLKRGGHTEVLDIIDIPCIRSADDPYQPENWIIDPGAAWTRIGRVKKARLGEFVEAPDQLWASSGRTDRVAAAFLQRSPPAQSLFLVHIPSATIVRDTKSGYRLRFRYHGIDYALKITDPTLSSQFGFALYEAEGVPLEDVHACLSLGGNFHGFHYKLVATSFV